MNQYLIGFISATMLTTSFFLFVGAKKRTIDNLTVQKITIVDESGNQVGEIGNKQLSSYFWLKSQRNNSIGFQISAGTKSSGLTVQNSRGKRILDLGVGKNNGGNILVNGKNGTNSIKLASSDGGGGNLKCYNLREQETVFLGTNKINGGQVKTYNGLGSETVFIGTGQNDAGLLTINNNLGFTRSIVGVDEVDRGKVETTNN